jgi:PQQ-like domain
MIITAYSIKTGTKIWSKTVNIPNYSRSDFITDHGKIAVNTIYGNWLAYDLNNGNLAWQTSPTGDYPWASHSFGAYAVCSAYGMFYKFAYDGVYAYNWNDGKEVWHYLSPALSVYETPYIDNGTAVMSFNGGCEVVDGKMYVYNTEHTPSCP